MAPIMYSIEDWLLQNQQFFKPPICNKLMYRDGYLKCFFVGGPNQRKDFHLEEGEEFFYMLKGDMNLIVVEKGKFKDIIIKEGQVFLLPRCIPHSPQRFEGTIGMVIERERESSEIDGLRYYVDGSTEILYEKWFHCESLDSQLPPLIKEYFASEQYRTGKPLAGTVLTEKPVKQDFNRVLDSPFYLKDWIRENQDILKTENRKALFEGNCTSKINILGSGAHTEEEDTPETFLWQIEGDGIVTNANENYELKKNYTILLDKNEKWQLKNAYGGYTLQVIMCPS